MKSIETGFSPVLCHKQAKDSKMVELVENLFKGSYSEEIFNATNSSLFLCGPDTQPTNPVSSIKKYKYTFDILF